MTYDPNLKYFGRYSPQDGAVDFYGRVNSILEPDMEILDLGAGRGAWYEEDKSPWRRNLRDFRKKVRKVIAADVDEIVLRNKTAHECLLIVNGHIPLPDQSVDVIIADYVLEHITDPIPFTNEIDRVLKKNGFFCARTPHKYHYVSIAARLIPNKQHKQYVKKAQPDRNEMDVFPTAYKMNTLKEIKKIFHKYQDYSFIYRCEPAYFFGKKIIYRVQDIVHRILPSPIIGNIFIFLKKEN